VLSSPRASKVEKHDEPVKPVEVVPLPIIKTVEKDIDLSDITSEKEPETEPLIPEDPETEVDIEAEK